VISTVAFLCRDAVALHAAHSAYTAIAPGSLRLRIIEGFIDRPTESYMNAAHCKM